ncbi:hypothetical protein BABINDRAFT_161735 [Babjeviella inositovora NRRL Y-12698]|uniref:Endoribonuclease YSH1 n=1 Tax=Babjeviella inositovora NRRL Y-12698 TaxID=984486 RepID=A0A1E3QNR8_9ASCO|nr:uncharacterized protein BABINDRAFT_161735 [Babjeviella inositovora NRRL Y-12698]ODQ79325.1 hypothetical protein BABINDRAFT_161735 [Babjeviella inositovora NRRL Y-12698]
MQHTNFRGRVFMTHPTKAIYRWLLSDFVRVTSIGNDNAEGGNLYTDDDLIESFDRIETVDFHSTVEIEGIRFTAYHAGHVLGAAMFLIEIGGLKILFTGDYSREEDRHLNIAEVPPVRPDVLITESTFGTATHEPREDKESRLTNLIHDTVLKGGRCLLPVFALGRAQEILLILDDYWKHNADLQSIPVYYASSLARKCMAVYQTYINMMNDSIRLKFRDSQTNPFQFKYIKSIKNLDKFDDFGACVVIASPGMLQNGVSRELLERWSPDSKNSLILTGYSVEGTMAKDILTEPTVIPSVNNPEQMIPRRIRIEEISFAAHVDYEQNAKFIELLNPSSIILVHGESNPMGRLKSALLSKYAKFKSTAQEVKVYNPRNCDVVRLPFKGVKVAKATGIVASVHPQPGSVLSGVLVNKDFDLQLLKPADLREYSNLTSTIVRERNTVAINATKELLAWHLVQMFGHVDVLIDEDDEYEITIMDAVTINYDLPQKLVVVEWESGVVNDTIADSVIAIVLAVDSSPASVKLSSKLCTHDHAKIEETDDVLEKIHTCKISPPPFSSSPAEDRLARILTLLKVQFGKTLAVDDMGDSATIKIGKTEATIDLHALKVTCASAVIRGRIEGVLKRGASLAAPLAQKRK